jgi:hypothetical protein
MSGSDSDEIDRERECSRIWIAPIPNDNVFTIIEKKMFTNGQPKNGPLRNGQ